MTVNELYELCKIEIELGNGSRSVVISDDEEGNGYHDCFYPFLHNIKDIKECLDCTCSWNHISETDPENIILLG